MRRCPWAPAPARPTLAVRPLAAAALTRTRAVSARRLSRGVSATIRAPPKSMATSMLTGNAVPGGWVKAGKAAAPASTPAAVSAAAEATSHLSGGGPAAR